jgi:hypothetical protein
MSPALNLQLQCSVDICRVFYTNLSLFYDKQLLRGCLLITSTCFPHTVAHMPLLVRQTLLTSTRP